MSQCNFSGVNDAKIEWRSGAVSGDGGSGISAGTGVEGNEMLPIKGVDGTEISVGGENDMDGRFAIRIERGEGGENDEREVGGEDELEENDRRLSEKGE
jgi:hypothetical protein